MSDMVEQESVQEELLERIVSAQENKDDDLESKYLTFELDGQEYCLKLQHIVEIIGVHSITHVPKLPGYIAGIINLRGKVLPVINMRARFGKPVVAFNEKTCILITQYEDTQAGLIVDGVDEVVNITETDILQPPNATDPNANFIVGVSHSAEHIRLILDCDQVLNS